MQKIGLVIPLEAIRDQDKPAVGNKALGLARMNRIGIPVPPGFCITEAAFRQHLRLNNLTGHIKSVAEELSAASPADRGPLLSDLRQTIIKAPLADTLREQIEYHYQALGAEHVAVRSSATAEDLPGHSFAGQYDTYLGIPKLEDCIEAVKKCWASLWTLRAFEYRGKNGFDHLQINMAVIVQLLVAADASGVIFTVDPVTGERGNMVIEACFGLGEALVSGKVTPDRFVVDKKKLKLISQTISEKKIKSILDGNSLVKEQTVPNEKSSDCCLDKIQVKRLAKLARKVETEFGCPQDIEWAVCKKKIHFLQSRPITALPPEKSWEDRQMWCCNPAKEVIPDVATPMTTSVIDAMLDGFIDPVIRLLCMDRGDHPIYGLVAGRIYFNANIWGSVFRDLPGGRDFDGMALAGSHRGLQEVTRKLQAATDEDLPDMKFKRFRFYLKIPLIIIGMLRNTPKKGRRILTKIEAKNKKWSRIDAVNMTAEEIGAYCREIMTDLKGLLSHGIYLCSIMAALPILDTICSKWLPDGNVNAGRLLAGVGGMVDAVAGLDIWRLASAAGLNTQVKNLREFLACWNGFMLRHGHHCRGELELYNKRWSETPDYILKFVRSHMTQMDKIDPVQNFDRATTERHKIEKQYRKQLKNPIKRLIFNHILNRAQKGSVFRENVKSEVIRLLTAKRKMLLELGKRLRDKGVLKNQDDVFFLRFEELEPVVRDKADFDIHQVITDRRTEYDRNSLITPPDVVFGRFDPDKYIPDTIDEQAQELNGLGVSPGTATGKARVILRADTEEQLLAGEILVAPFTDPGWTPYFVPASAIVMDEGGVISHGSIVAREYGIPAVVNVGGATKIIKTGQTIQVDGNRGVVRLLQ
jgi:pyruvate,water dikinase